MNPEFLGIIFERLVNKEDGAVYTPRTEVDFMCRISLVKWLQKMAVVDVKDLYHLFFRERGYAEADEDFQKHGDFSKAELRELITLLKNVAICDPASGSGAFPVGMMQVLNEILENLQTRPYTPEEYQKEDAFDRKKAIIANSLYGVEVKRWAVWINQLRLWLSLFVDIPTERNEELRFSPTPLLPNLDFKIRCGDSLVQRIGDKLFTVRGQNMEISESMKRRITVLKKEKIDFFYNRSGSAREIKRKESLIFREIIDDQINERQKQIRAIKRPKAEQTNLFGNAPKQTNFEFDANRIAQLEAEIETLQAERAAFKDEHPLIWTIEFSEIFFEKKGFDIIIGNPPYVRQEDIGDPNDKLPAKSYKALLQKVVRNEFPYYFKIKEKIAGKSDLYTYFYFKSLSLLNPNGVHTFICSNSWLDVGYGTWVQKFLLSYCYVHFIIDNHAKRSFANADVNTIITVIDAPVELKQNLKHSFPYKFVAYKKSYDQVIFSENLIEIEQQRYKIINNELYRSYPKTIAELWGEGSEISEGTSGADQLRYIGDKWGGKYLRAPDIFFTILEKGKDKLIKLKDIAEIRRGITTGCNDFFYLTKNDVEKWQIEKEFLRPIIKSPQECKTYLLDDNDLKFNVFICNKKKEDLKGTNALKYIKYGETIEIQIDQGVKKGTKLIGVHNLASVKGRKLWYQLDKINGNTFFSKELRERLFTSFSIKELIVDCRLYTAILPLETQLYCNSTLFHFFGEVIKRDLGGGGGPRSMMVYEVNQSLIINPKFLNFKQIELNRGIKTIFQECGIDPKSPVPIEEQEPNPLPDRKRLDDVVFDAIGLSTIERKDVYRALCRLVWNRISKAKNL